MAASDLPLGIWLHFYNLLEGYAWFLAFCPILCRLLQLLPTLLSPGPIGPVWVRMRGISGILYNAASLGLVTGRLRPFFLAPTG